MSQPTRESIEGRATGTYFFVGFGALWVVTGLQAMHRITAGSLAAIVGLALALSAAAVMLTRRARRLPASVEDSAERLRLTRVFHAVNITQWIAVAAAIVTLNLVHLPIYIVPAIATIVGLHLFH